VLTCHEGEPLPGHPGGLVRPILTVDRATGLGVIFASRCPGVAPNRKAGSGAIAETRSTTR